MTLLESIERAKERYLSYPKWKQNLIDDFINGTLREPNIELSKIDWTDKSCGKESGGHGVM